MLSVNSTKITSSFSLQWPDENLKKLQDQNYLKFIKKLLEYFKPTNKLYSEVDYGRSHGRKLSVVGCQLVDYLQEADEVSKVQTFSGPNINF